MLFKNLVLFWILPVSIIFIFQVSAEGRSVNKEVARFPFLLLASSLTFLVSGFMLFINLRLGGKRITSLILSYAIFSCVGFMMLLLVIKLGSYQDVEPLGPTIFFLILFLVYVIRSVRMTRLTLP